MDLPKSAGLQELLLSDEPYAGKYAVAVSCATTYGASELLAAYSAEYSSWRNRKSWAKKNKVIWSDEMNMFSDFLVVNGPIPQQSWTLDRIHSIGAYVPQNLRWASKTLQSRNRTCTRVLKIKGELLSISDIAKRSGQTYDCVRMALARQGDEHAPFLLSVARAEAIASEEDRWEFPEEYRQALEELYSRRTAKDLNKVLFFIDLTEKDLDETSREAQYECDSIRKAEIQVEIDTLRKLCNDAISFVRTVRTYALHEKLYGHLDVPPQYDDPAAYAPYNPYEDERTDWTPI